MTTVPPRLPLRPFPPLVWWGAALEGSATLDVHEHYQKRSFRNRYWIMTSNGPESCSVPVERRGGIPRPQDQIFRAAGDADRKAWQAVRSAYGRSPFFEEMAPELEALFLEGGATLGEWNRATLEWASGWLDIPVPRDAHPPWEPFDAAVVQEGDGMEDARVPRWAHIWEGRHHDIPYQRLGILDALLHLGPAARGLINPIPPSGFRHPG